jgi:membrane protease YdiL (CAAX protease family)
MDTFPPFNQQLLWIAILSILSILALKVIKKKNLLAIPSTTIASINLKDVIYNFGFYLVLSIAVVPLVFALVKNTYIKSPIETISLFQLFFMTLVSGFILCYLKIKKIVLFKKPASFGEAFIKVLLYLIVIFPIVSLIGQLCDTYLYLAYDVRGYEQLAVTYLKKTIHNPLALGASVISIVILAPLTEELLFRGLLLNFFQNRFGSWPAVFISGILFALFHYSHSQGFGNVSLLCALSFFGVMLGAFYLMTASLIYPMMLHAIFNLLSTLRILFLENS